MSPSRRPETITDFWREFLTDEMLQYFEEVGPTPAVRESWRRLYSAYLRAQYEMFRGLLDAVEVQLKEVERSAKPKARRPAKRAKSKRAGTKRSSRKSARRVPVS